MYNLFRTINEGVSKIRPRIKDEHIFTNEVSHLRKMNLCSKQEMRPHSAWRVLRNDRDLTESTLATSACLNAVNFYRLKKTRIHTALLS